MAKSRQPLTLDKLRAGLPPGLTPHMGAMMAEAAAVVLETNGHQSGVPFLVKDASPRRFTLTWHPPHPDARRAHSDLPEAVQYAAYGVAMLLIDVLTDFNVIERSYKGTGIDYWLAQRGGLPFQRAAKLEVSGILRGSSRLQPRLHAKMKQVRRYPNSLSTFIVIVEFGRPEAILRKL